MGRNVQELVSIKDDGHKIILSDGRFCGVFYSPALPRSQFDWFPILMFCLALLALGGNAWGQTVEPIYAADTIGETSFGATYGSASTGAMNLSKNSYPSGAANNSLYKVKAICYASGSYTGTWAFVTKGYDSSNNLQQQVNYSHQSSVNTSPSSINTVTSGYMHIFLGYVNGTRIEVLGSGTNIAIKSISYELVGTTANLPPVPTISIAGSGAKTVTLSGISSGSYQFNLNPTVSQHPYGGGSTVYDSPVVYSTPGTYTIRAAGTVGGGGLFSNTSETTFTVTAETVATPVLTPGGGNHTAPVILSATCATSGATIYYTDDGSTPSAASNVWVDGLSLSTSKTLKLIGIKSGLTNSEILTAAYNVSNPVCATPTVNNGSGTYTAPLSITANCITGGATIRYTTDGSEPTVNSATWSNGYTFDSSFTLKLMAHASGFQNSTIATFNYTVNTPTVAAPEFAPGGGDYLEAIEVNATCATSGATIRFTEDGSEPTSSSPLLTNHSLDSNGSFVLRARAFKSGYLPSPITTATYNLQLQQCETPTFNHASGSLEAGTLITCICATSGATIRFTEDGSTVNEFKPFWSNRNLSENVTFKARAYKSGFSPSEEATVSFTVVNPSIPAIDWVYPNQNPSHTSSHSFIVQVVTPWLTIPEAYATAKVRYRNWASDPWSDWEVMEVAPGYSNQRRKILGVSESTYNATTFFIEVELSYAGYNSVSDSRTVVVRSSEQSCECGAISPVYPQAIDNAQWNDTRQEVNWVPVGANATSYPPTFYGMGKEGRPLPSGWFVAGKLNQVTSSCGSLYLSFTCYVFPPVGSDCESCGNVVNLLVGIGRNGRIFIKPESFNTQRQNGGMVDATDFANAPWTSYGGSAQDLSGANGGGWDYLGKRGFVRYHQIPKEFWISVLGHANVFADRVTDDNFPLSRINIDSNGSTDVVNGVTNNNVSVVRGRELVEAIQSQLNGGNPDWSGFIPLCASSGELQGSGGGGTTPTDNPWYDAAPSIGELDTGDSDGDQIPNWADPENSSSNSQIPSLEDLEERWAGLKPQMGFDPQTLEANPLQKTFTFTAFGAVRTFNLDLSLESYPEPTRSNLIAIRTIARTFALFYLAWYVLGSVMAILGME